MTIRSEEAIPFTTSSTTMTKTTTTTTTTSGTGRLLRGRNTFAIVVTVVSCLAAVSTYLFSAGGKSTTTTTTATTTTTTTPTVVASKASKETAFDAVAVAVAFGCYDFDDDDFEKDFEKDFDVIDRVRGCLEGIATAVDAVEKAFGCDDDDDDDDDDGDDDDGSATTTTTTAAAGTSSSASSCLARIATDRSEKNRAQQVHVSKRIQDARDRAVVVVVAKNNNNTLTTIQPSLLLDDNNNNNSNSNSNNNTNSSGGEAMMALAPKPEWRIGATPQRNNVTTNATTNVSSSSSSLPSSSLPSSLGLAYANIEIAGMPKAGTSHLYNLLTQRPDTIRFWGGKEYCAGKGKLFVTPTLSQLHKFHDRAFTRNSNEREKRRSQQREDDEPLVSVNGCIYLPDVIGRYEYLWGDAGSSSEGGGGEQEGRKKHQQQQKFVILLRDPADWLWSAWNFWIQPSFDVTVLQHDWADYKVNYRSPELFHELLLAGPDGILDFPGHAETFRRIGEEEIRRLRELAGTENVLVLKNEDMRPDLASANGGLLDVLSDFTGLNRSLFDDDLVQSYSNCNDKPGEKQRCTSAPPGYEIDGNRPMLPESRELVYLYFRQECRYWSKELNVHYPDCVNVRPTLPWPDVVVVDDHDDDDDGVGTPPPPP